MRKSMWKPLVIALALALALTSVVVYADKPNCGPNQDEHCDHGKGGNGNGVAIEASNFVFTPQDFPEKPADFADTTTPIQWGLLEGKHNISICEVDSNAAAGVCASGDVIFGQDFNKNRLVISFKFDDPKFAGKTINYFCRFHGLRRGMVGTVTVPS